MPRAERRLWPRSVRRRAERDRRRRGAVQDEGPDADALREFQATAGRRRRRARHRERRWAGRLTGGRRGGADGSARARLGEARRLLARQHPHPLAADG